MKRLELRPQMSFSKFCMERRFCWVPSGTLQGSYQGKVKLEEGFLEAIAIVPRERKMETNYDAVWGGGVEGLRLDGQISYFLHRVSSRVLTCHKNTPPQIVTRVPTIHESEQRDRCSNLSLPFCAGFLYFESILQTSKTIFRTFHESCVCELVWRIKEKHSKVRMLVDHLLKKQTYFQ